MSGAAADLQARISDHTEAVKVLAERGLGKVSAGDEDGLERPEVIVLQVKAD
jgi:hypothetical protein